jgi:hypothetical protein
MYDNISEACWTVRIPLSLRAEIERLARADRRKPSEMLRLILLDALAQRNSNTKDSNKKADAT